MTKLLAILLLCTACSSASPEDATVTGYLGDHCDENRECQGLSQDLAGRQVASCIASVCSFTCNTKAQVKACTELGGTCFGACQLD